MSQHRVVKLMNRHPYACFLALSLAGWLVLIGKEVGVMLHSGKPVDWVFAGAMALVSLIGAGIAGLAIDVLLLVREEQAGEVD